MSLVHVNMNKRLCMKADQEPAREVVDSRLVTCFKCMRMDQESEMIAMIPEGGTMRFHCHKLALVTVGYICPKPKDEEGV